MINNIKTISYQGAQDDFLFIDVRSPAEYNEDHIPGAVNLPLFTDDERKTVGTVYTQSDKHEAKRIAVGFVAPKLPGMMDSITALCKKNPHIACYCQKGGYRSSFVVSAFNAVDIRLSQLEGGYKVYRDHVRENLPIENEKLHFVVLHGNTGTGKTELLKALAKLGRDVIDLEGAANHRGSLLGSIGLGDAHSQKRFESLIYQQIRGRKADTVFIEAESDRIGNVIIPKYISDKMKYGQKILIEAELSVRSEMLKKEYGNSREWAEEARQVMGGIEKYVGRTKYQNMLTAIEKHNFEEIAELLMTQYYDPMYEHKSKHLDFAMIIQNTGCAEKAARMISDKFD